MEALIQSKSTQTAKRFRVGVAQLTRYCCEVVLLGLWQRY
jgi:hypothetical protein